METLATKLADYLLQQSWQIAVLIGIVTLINRVLRHKSAHIRYLLWLLVLAKCLGPPVFNMSVAVLPSESVVHAAPDAGGALIAKVKGNQAVYPGRVDTTAVIPSLPLAHRLLTLVRRHWTLAIWGIVALGFYAICMVRMIRIRRRLLCHRRPASEQIQNDLEVISEGCGLSEAPRAWFVDEASQPFVLGWLKGAVYLPTSFSAINKAEHRRAILAHEMGHIRRCDAGVNLLQIIAQGLFWFHPLVWWANVQMRKEREKCCDETAVARTATDARDYCRALVNVLKSSRMDRLPLGSVAVSASVKNMEERIKAIMNAQSFCARPSVALTISIIAVALALASTSCHLCKKETVETPPETSSQNDSKLNVFVFIDVRFVSVPADSKTTKEFLKRKDIELINQEMTVDVSQIDIKKMPNNGNDDNASVFKRQITALESKSVSIQVMTTEQRDAFENLPHAKVTANPQVLALDGRLAEFGIITEEYFMLEPDTQKWTPRKTECGTKLYITPQISHGDDTIVMDVAFEISDLISDEGAESPSVKAWKGASTVVIGEGQSVLIPVVDAHKGSAFYAVVTANSTTQANRPCPE